MKLTFDFEKEFLDVFPLESAAKRFTESKEVARRITLEGVDLMPNMDHTAIMGDPPRLVTGPIRALGYEPGWDDRSYPSPVDGHEFWQLTARLPPGSPLRERGWFDYIATVWSINQQAYDYFIAQGQGNPFLHHMTMGIVPLERGAAESDLDYAYRLIPYMLDVHRRIEQGTGEDASQVIASLPDSVFSDPEFRARVPELMKPLGRKPYVIEKMEGGGFLVQFFVLPGARIEVACRHRTKQSFNPRSTERFTREEISIGKSVIETEMVAATRR